MAVYLGCWSKVCAKAPKFIVQIGVTSGCCAHPLAALAAKSGVGAERMSKVCGVSWPSVFEYGHRVSDWTASLG